MPIEFESVPPVTTPVPTALAAQSPALAFAYGLALADAGNLTEARRLLGALPPESLTTAEVALIREKLKE